jgi:hypothetical protein
MLLVVLGACAHAVPHASSAKAAPNSTSAPLTRRHRRHHLRPARTATATTAAPTLGPGVLAMAMVGSVPVVTVRRVAPAGTDQGAITVATFNARRTRLVLHAGSLEPVAGQTWSYGPQVGPQERTALLAAFNAGFKMADARGGWLSQSRVVVPLVPGAASVVVYADGGTDIGAWGVEVPASGRDVVSVRQNLQLLIDAGRPLHIHPSSEAQLEKWWGVAYAGAPLIARSALGITASGKLVWAAGTDITPAALADALLAQGVQRALELDINAPLVRGFLYPGPATLTTAATLSDGFLPLVVGQTQPSAGQSPTGADPVPHCTYLTTCSRDFFTVLIRHSGRGQQRPRVPGSPRRNS